MRPRTPIVTGLLAALLVAATAQRHDRPAGEGGRTRQVEPPTAAEVESALKELKRSRRGDRKQLAVVLRSDHAEGRRYVSNMLRGAFDGQKRNLIEMMGETSPPSWWEVVAEHADDRDEDVRAAVAVALAGFAEPKAAKLVRQRLQREKADAVRGPLCLALAASAPKDPAVAAELDRLAEHGRSGDSVRLHATLAAARIADEEAALRLVRRALADASARVRTAAAVATAERRLAKAVPDLRVAAEHEPDPDARRHLQAAIRAVETGDLRHFENAYRRLVREGRKGGGDSDKPRRQP